jgi:hypothetical protein
MASISQNDYTNFYDVTSARTHAYTNTHRVIYNSGVYCKSASRVEK